MRMEQLTIAFILTLFAGIAMGIGGVLGFVGEKKSTKFFTGSVGFAAGVMLYAAFVEIFPESVEALQDILGNRNGMIIGTLAFFCGILFMVCVENIFFTHEHHNKSMYRMGIMTAVAIAIHNFPEGIAIFTSALRDTKLGISVALAIAIHNIAVGIAISTPIYYGTGSKKKAFIVSLLAGLFEPIGAIIGYWALHNYLDERIFGLILAIVAGIMVYISLDELIPSAHTEHNHIGTYSIIAGMGIMAITTIFI